MALAASLRGGGGGGGGGSGMDMGTSGWSSMSNSALLPAVSLGADLLSTRRRHGAAATMMTEARAAAAGEVSGEVWDGVGGETGYGTYNAILKMLLFLETAMINMLSISWNLYNSANCAKTHSSENKYIIEQRLHKQL